MTEAGKGIQAVLDDTITVLKQVVGAHRPGLRTQEVGRVRSVGNGIALVAGLPGVRSEELIRFPGGLLGVAFNVDPSEAGVILLGDTGDLQAGAEARRTGRVLDVPVGEALLGRVVDALGRPLDDLGPIRTLERRPVEREAPPIMARAPVTVPLQTGLKVVDALVPIGRGQRELILGDRQTGKTAIVLDTLINQRDPGVICVYCAIGQRDTAVAELIADLRQQGVMDYCIVVVAPGEALPGLHFVAPYAATSMAEYFMEQGRDVLIIYDNLSNHARSYRELSLLLRRPPGREAYPGDIFYIHSRLLERSTHLRPEHGGGSLTALPIVETEAQNIAAYIPTNLISITDGQIYLTPAFSRRAFFPRWTWASRYPGWEARPNCPPTGPWPGTCACRIPSSRSWKPFPASAPGWMSAPARPWIMAIASGKCSSRAQFDPMPVAAQIAVLLAVTQGLFDDSPWSGWRPGKRRCGTCSARTFRSCAGASKPG